MNSSPVTPDFVDAFANQTYLAPLITVLLALSCIMTLSTKRNYVFIPYFIIQTFVTPAQRIYLAGMNFPAMRILICMALLRIILRKEYASWRIILLDKVLIFFAVISTVAYYVQVPSSASIVYALGTFFDILGGYLVVRVLVRDGGDIEVAVMTLAILSFFVVVIFVYDARTGHNLLSVLGGIPESPELRSGRLRVQGAYPHAILAGAYWAAILPLLIGYRIREGIRRPLMYIAVPCCVVIVILCASSTPLLSLVVGVAASLLYYKRASRNAIKIAAIMGFVGLSLVMHHPIWFLFTKIDLAGGSTGYFRYLLVDNFINHWRDWLLIGVRNPGSWGTNLSLPSAGLADLVNQFVAVGVGGGLLSLAAFVTTIVIAFDYIGIIVNSEVNEDYRRRSWHVGVSLLVHVSSFLGVSYWGQVKYAWWMALAFCGSLYQYGLVLRRENSPEKK